MPAKKEIRVMAADIKAILIRTRSASAGNSDEAKHSRKALAEVAGCSSRTIDRIMADERETIELDMADRIVLAAGGGLNECRVLLPTGEIEDY